MQVKGVNLCDFCFSPVEPGVVCPYCGQTHDTYRSEIGLLTPGTPLLGGKYVIGRVLGRGGFGVTYLAYSFEHNVPVAIKEYFPNGFATRAKGEVNISIVSDEKRETFGKGAKRFFEEAQTMARFNQNPNIVSVYEFFYDNGTVYYAMEYLDGIDLKGYIARNGGRISESEAIRIMKCICDALQAVHSTQTLHRDVAPDNIFMCNDGRIKLIDFGAAKQVIGNAQQVYSVVVKKGFAPLEQYNSTGHQGTWTDLYALGASIYYAVTGTFPPDAVSRTENPMIPFNPALGLSQGFINILGRCMEIPIYNRFQSALELRYALDHVYDSIPMPPSPPPPSPDRHWERWIIGTAALFIVILLVVLVVSMFMGRRPPNADPYNRDPNRSQNVEQKDPKPEPGDKKMQNPLEEQFKINL